MDGLPFLANIKCLLLLDPALKSSTYTLKYKYLDSTGKFIIEEVHIHE